MEASCREGDVNVVAAKRYIKYINELPYEELSVRGVLDQFRIIMEVSKMIQKEDVCIKSLGYLSIVTKGVEMFDREWRTLVEAGLPPCWD